MKAASGARRRLTDEAGDRRRRFIALVLGKPPGGSSILPEVAARLRDEGFRVAVHLPHEAAEAVPAWLCDVDLVVHRGLDRRALAAIHHLERAGIRCCNPIRSVHSVRDRLLLIQTLSRAGLPTPATSRAGTWADAVTTARGQAVVVKARDGRRGRGAGVVLAPDGRVPAIAPFDGPYILQDFVTGAGREYKLYVAGRDVRVLLASASRLLGSEPAEPPEAPALIDLALRAGRALGLQIYGVDVLMGTDGPRIVDVNAFPGFRRVPDAPRLVAGAITDIARGGSSSATDPTAGR